MATCYSIRWKGKAKTEQMATVKLLTCLWLFGNGHMAFIQHGIFTIFYAESAATEPNMQINKHFVLHIPFCCLFLSVAQIC